MTQTSESAGVVFAERAAANGRCVALVRLDAERSLNALSLAMIDALLPKLDEWARRDDVVCLVLHGAGDKAFCAGGDVIGLYKAMRAAGGAPSAEAESFFAAEYRLDHAIHRFPKPVLCWGHGTVMGGGLGLMAGASHRVTTPATKIGMPEVTIGLFPDVCSSWFLGRMPNRTGLFLALTTTPVTAGDALWLGLGDYLVDSDRREAVFDALTGCAWQGQRAIDDSILAEALRGFEDGAHAAQARADSPVFAHQTEIARLTDAANVVEFEKRLGAQAERDDWFGHGVKAIAGACPTSLAVAHRQLRADPRLSVEGAFRQELAIAIHRTRDPDFAEGIRALLVDKDRKPAWQPARLAAVDPATVKAHFVLPEDYGQHPLADL